MGMQPARTGRVINILNARPGTPMAMRRPVIGIPADRRMLGAHPRIRLTEPLDYVPFVRLLARAALVITDSGGIQEEAPYLGVPVVVARENTERPEAVRWGATRLVAARHADVIEAAQALLAAPRPHAAAFNADAPFGDGLAGARIIESIGRRLAAATP